MKARLWIGMFATAATSLFAGGCDGTSVGNPAPKTPGDCEETESPLAGDEVDVWETSGGASGLSVDQEIAAVVGDYESEMKWLASGAESEPTTGVTVSINREDGPLSLS